MLPGHREVDVVSTSVAPGLDRIGPFVLRAQRANDTSCYDALDERDATEAYVHVFDDRALVKTVLAARQLWSSVGHPAFARLLDAGVDDLGRAYFGVEELAGESLYSLVRASGPAHAREAVELARQLLSAAGALHAQGHLLHADGGDVRIGLVDGRPQVRVDLTLFPRRRGRAPALCGPPQLEAPEVAMGAAPDERADVWRVGVLLFYMLTGIMPFDGNTAAEVWREVTTKAPAPFRVELGVSRALQQVVWRALEKNPDDRFANVTAFEAALVGL
jgi:serine/threonine-protein kinase